MLKHVPVLFGESNQMIIITNDHIREKGINVLVSCLCST